MNPYLTSEDSDFIMALEAELASETKYEGLKSLILELDSDIFGEIHKVWRGAKLLGVIWQSPVTLQWIADIFREGHESQTSQNFTLAKLAIIKAWELE